jgi:hypothetical protein
MLANNIKSLPPQKKKNKSDSNEKPPEVEKLEIDE